MSAYRLPLAFAAIVGVAACADVIGLDPGTAEGAEGGGGDARADATDAHDAPAEDAALADAADGHAATDAPTCRPTLQPCSVGTDCCSGMCGAALTCL